MTPLNQKQGYKEAKVGVIFWEKDHQKGKGKRRGRIRQREYIATLKSRQEFRTRVSQLYKQVAENQTTHTVVIGDGAHWTSGNGTRTISQFGRNSRFFSSF